MAEECALSEFGVASVRAAFPKVTGSGTLKDGGNLVDLGACSVAPKELNEIERKRLTVLGVQP